MNVTLKILAILLVVDAIVLMTRPGLLKRIRPLADGKNIYLAAFLKAVVGVVFLFGANDKCTMPAVIIAFGLLALASAIFIVAAPEKAKKITIWLTERSVFTIRIIAAIYLLVAALLVYAA